MVEVNRIFATLKGCLPLKIVQTFHSIAAESVRPKTSQKYPASFSIAHNSRSTPPLRLGRKNKSTLASRNRSLTFSTAPLRPRWKARAKRSKLEAFDTSVLCVEESGFMGPSCGEGLDFPS